MGGILYMHTFIQNIADKTIERFDDINPINIANSLKRVVFTTAPLGDNINGFYKFISLNKQMIVINENLSEEEFNFTLFHELAHYFLKHRDALLLNSTFSLNIKEEYQADLFATYMYMKYKKDCLDYNCPIRVKELMKKFR